MPKKIIQTQAEKAADIIAGYLKTTNAILVDYLSNEDMMEELTIADENLKEDIETLCEPVDFDGCINRLNELRTDGGYEADFFGEEADKLLAMIDDEYIKAKAACVGGYVLVKLNSLADYMKLEEFLTTQLYPLDSDQMLNLNL